ncbi:unnamed protein product [Cochlearia groenlandica]
MPRKIKNVSTEKMSTPATHRDVPIILGGVELPGLGGIGTEPLRHELIKMGVEGFLATITIERGEGDLDLHEIPVAEEYKDVFELLKGSPPESADVLMIN